MSMPPPEPQWAERPYTPISASTPDSYDLDDTPDLPSAAPTPVQYVNPLVRKLANDLNVDLNSVTGTGVGGRIRPQDVTAAAEAARAASFEGGSDSLAPDSPSTTGAQQTSEIPSEIRSTSLPAIILEVDGTNLAYNFLPAVLKAAHEALVEYPALLAPIPAGSTPVLCVTLAATPGALNAAVQDLAEKGEDQIAAELAEVTAQAAAGTVDSGALSNSHFCVTDNTAQGTMLEIPQIHLRHVAALSVGARELRPKVIDEYGTIAARRMFFLCLSYDPSAADANTSSSFLKRIKAKLEG